jgi:FkbM family methyltransferase
MDADDLAWPRRLSMQIEFLRANPGITLVGGAIEVIDSQGRPSQIIRLPETPQDIRTHMRDRGCALAHPTVMFRRQAVLDVGGLRPAYRHAEDYDLWLRMLEKCDFSNLPEVLLSYRRHEGSVSNRNATQQMLSAFGARTAARLRLRGLADPTSSAELITREVVLSLGVDAQELDAEMFRGLYEATETAIDQGRPTAAVEFLTAARPFADAGVILDMALNLNRRALNTPASGEERDSWRRALLDASPQIYREVLGKGGKIDLLLHAVQPVGVVAETGGKDESSDVLNDILRRKRHDTDKSEEYLRRSNFAKLSSPDYDEQMLKRDLIFDVGMHRGDDTDFYLRKGFRVVGVEANPDLVRACRQRFAQEIQMGALVIEEGAISDSAESVSFYINSEKDDWSATDLAMASRGSGAVREIIVPSLRMGDLFRSHGIPYYLKIDIEGGDRQALGQLAVSSERPVYCSVEAHELSYLVRLFDLGYRQFKVVNQGNYWWFRCPNPPLEGVYVEHTFSIHSSGPFGEETAGRWMDLEEAALVYLTLKRLDTENNKLVYQWCDFHAR